MAYAPSLMRILGAHGFCNAKFRNLRASSVGKIICWDSKMRIPTPFRAEYTIKRHIPFAGLDVGVIEK